MNTISDNNINVNELDKDKNVQSNNNDQQLNSFELALKELDENPYLRYALDVVDKRNQYKSAESYLGSAGGFNDEGTMGLFVTNDPYGDPNMFEDRYKAFSSTYDKLGFSPYRNNDELYNINASGWEKTKVAMKAFAHLTWIAIQQNSVILSGINDNKRTKELATDYNYWNTIGMDSGEGFGAFARNLLVTYGSTAAVMLKMAVEEIAINVGITALTGGTGTAGSMAATSARFAKFGNFMNKVREGLKSANVIRKAYKQAGGLKRFRYTFSEFIAPGTWSGIARGVHNIKKGRTLEGGLNMLHGMYSTARAYKVTQSEALLEANLAAQEYVMEMYNSGKQFTDEQVEMIKRSAEAISNEVFWKNIPAIYLSNLVIFNDLLSPVAGRFVSKAFKGPNKLFGKLPQRLSHGKWYNQIYRFGKEDKRLWDYGIKSIPIALGYWIPKGGKMFAVGSVEGIQENIQDIINYSAKKYYHDMYLDNDRFHEILGSTVDVSGFGDAFKLDHLFGYSEAYQQQFTKQGWETFLTGTLMGGPTALISASVRGGYKAGERLVDKSKLNNIKKKRDAATVGSNEYNELDRQYKAKEKAYQYKYDVKDVRSDEWVNIYDQVFNKPTDFFNKNWENMVNINSTTSETQEELKFFDELIANAPNETSKQILQSQRERTEERAKIRQWNMIFRQLCANGEIDLVKSELERLKNEDDDVLSGLNNGNGSEDIKKRIDDCIKIIDQTQTVYDGLVKKFDNPQDMKGFLKKYGCKTEEEFVSKYGKNEDLMQLYHNEQMLGVAYSRAIDEMVYYANEYESAVKDKETLLDIFEKTLTKTNELLDNGLIPKGSSLTDVTSLYTEQSMQDLIDSNNVLIQSMKSQLEGTEDEKERNEINKKIEDLEYKNHQLGIIINALHEQKLDDTGNVVKDSDGKVEKLTADEFTNTIKDALQKYFKTSLNVEDDTLSNLLSEYFESYRNSKKLYDILQTITNPRNFNAIIENRNEILMDIYNKRYKIIQDSIAQYKKDSITNDLINKLYNEGYAVDNNFIARLLNKTSNKAGKIYKISDKNFNKEEVITSERPVTVYKYKDIDEAFKNSFDVELHPLSKEYHDVVKKIEEWINEQNNTLDDDKKLNTKWLFELNDLSNLNSYVEKFFDVTDQTIESIENEYFDNNTNELDVFEKEPTLHSINEVLDKIASKLPEGSPLVSLINSLKQYNTQNKVTIALSTNEEKLPYVIYGDTIFVDTRFFDSRYNSNQLEGFELGLLKANLDLILRDEFIKGKNEKLVNDLATAIGLEEGSGNIVKLASELSGFILGTRHVNFKSGVDTENLSKIKSTDVFYDFVNNLSKYLNDIGQTEGLNKDNLNGILDAIQVLFSGVGNYIAPKPASKPTGSSEQSESPTRNDKTEILNFGTSMDLADGTDAIKYNSLTKMQKVIINMYPQSPNVRLWLSKNDKDVDYLNDNKEIIKRTNDYETVYKAIQKGDISSLDASQQSIFNLIERENKTEVDYVYTDYFRLSQKEIDEYNEQIVNANKEVPAESVNGTVDELSMIDEYNEKTQLSFDEKEHTYTYVNENGEKVQADGSASSFYDLLVKSLGKTVSKKTDSSVSTRTGNIYDAAMREFMSTGKISDNIVDVITNEGFTVDDKDKIIKLLTEKCKKARQKIIEGIGGTNSKINDFKFDTTERRYVVRINISDKTRKWSYVIGMSHDMVVEYKGNKYLVDFKTTLEDPKKLSSKEEYNRQTFLYKLALDAITKGDIKARYVVGQQVTTNDNVEVSFSTNTEPELVLFMKKPVFSVGETEFKIDSVDLITDENVIDDTEYKKNMQNVVTAFQRKNNNATSPANEQSIELLNMSIDRFGLDKKETIENVLDTYKYKNRPKGNIQYIIKCVKTDDSGNEIITYKLSTSIDTTDYGEIKGYYMYNNFTTNLVYELNTINDNTSVVEVTADTKQIETKMEEYNKEIRLLINEESKQFSTEDFTKLLSEKCE